MEEFTKFVTKIGYLLAFGIVVVIGLAIYEKCDEAGYVIHNRKGTLYMTDDWLVGEDRACIPLIDVDANGKQQGTIDGMSCTNGELLSGSPHSMTIGYWGVVKPVDMDGRYRPVPSEWRCTRETDKFTCHAKKQ